MARTKTPSQYKANKELLRIIDAMEIIFEKAADERANNELDNTLFEGNPPKKISLPVSKTHGPCTQQLQRAFDHICDSYPDIRLQFHSPVVKTKGWRPGLNRYEMEVKLPDDPKAAFEKMRNQLEEKGYNLEIPTSYIAWSQIRMPANKLIIDLLNSIQQDTDHYVVQATDKQRVSIPTETATPAQVESLMNILCALRDAAFGENKRILAISETRNGITLGANDLTETFEHFKMFLGDNKNKATIKDALWDSDPEGKHQVTLSHMFSAADNNRCAGRG